MSATETTHDVNNAVTALLYDAGRSSLQAIQELRQAYRHAAITIDSFNALLLRPITTEARSTFEEQVKMWRHVMTQLETLIKGLEA